MSRRKTWILAALTSGICFLIGALITVEMPKAQSWILVQIEKVSREQLPVRILPMSAEVDFFPLGTTLHGVRIAPKDSLQKIFDPLVIHRVSVQLSLWQLLQGKLRLSAIEIEGTQVNVRVPKSEKKSDRPLAGLFDILNQIPINRIELREVDANITINEPRLQVSTRGLNLSIECRHSLVALTVERSEIKATDPDTHANILVDFETELHATPELLEVDSLKIRRGDSFFTGTGHLVGDTEALSFKSGEANLQSELQLESTRNWLVKTYPKLGKIPPLKGRAYVDLQAKRIAGHDPDIDIKAHTENFQVMKIMLDRLSLKGRVHGGQLKFSQASLDNSAAHVTVSDLTMSTKDQWNLSGKLHAPPIQMHELLKTFGLGDIPVFANFSGDLPCSGALNPFLINCNGQVKGDSVVIKSDMQEKVPIVALKVFSMQGEVAIDSQKVSYKTELAMPDSKGRSSGFVDYDKGFQISYEGDRLSTKDITSLIGLKLEGAFKIKGTTEGNSQTAKAQMLVDGTNVWFEDYYLGNVKSELGYGNGVVNFSNAQGYYTVSRYSGDIKLNVSNKQIAVNARVPFFDMKDMMNAFSRKVQLPFSVTGTGQAQITLSGPLQFNKLTYDLKTSVYRGSVAGETFDQANFDIKDLNGEVKAERVQITKNHALITLHGNGHPDGNIETVLHGRGIHLEDTAIVGRSGLLLSGLIDFDMDLTGYVLGPDTDLRGTLTKTAIGDQTVPDSKFKIKFNKKSLEGNGNLFGDVVRADIQYPYDAETPFHLKLNTQDWNFAPLFAAFTGPTSRKDYEGRLTSAIDLSAPTGGLWNSNGTIRVDQFLLSRGSLSLKSTEPMQMSMKNGQMHVQNFQLSGENTFLKLTENPNPVAKLDLQANGKLDLNLLALLTPFFEDLRGILSFAFNVKGGDRPTEILGSAYIDRGYLKFFDFPHPFENIQADLAFNQKKILFNSIRSEFAGGRITGTGGMELKGYKNYPVNVVAQFEKVNLNIPDQMRTSGSGNLQFSGNWFPFSLKGTYDVSDGMITKEFGGDGGQASASDGIRRDNYLPEFLLEESFIPLLVDLKINMPNGVQVKNEMMEGKVLGQVTVRGNPSKAAIGGTLTTDKTARITFKDTVFDVSSSNIQFTDTVEINPKIYLSAQARVQEYDVNLLVQGTGQNPKLSLTSVPPLPEKDLISLLAVGATDSQLENRINSSSQGANSFGQIGSGVMKKNPISNAIKDKLGVDVQFAPGFDESNNSVQKVIVSRQFSPKFGISATRSFGSSTETDARVNYRLNERFSLIGSMQATDYTPNTTTAQTDPTAPPAPTAPKSSTILGVDVEYKFEFK